MYKNVLVAGLWMVLAGVLPGQERAGYFHHLTVEDGLSQGTNHFIYKDSTGFVWLSSLSGLNRFDGRQVKVYQPVPGDSTSLFGLNIQSSFFETQERNLWFSTWVGLNCYVRKYDHFRHFILKKEDGTPVLGYYVFHLDQQGKLWVIVDSNKLYHFDIRSEEFIYQHDLDVAALRAMADTDEKGEVRRVYYLRRQFNGILIADYQNGVKTSARLRLDDHSSTPLVVKKVIPKGDSCWMATNRGLVLYLPVLEELRFFPSPGLGNEDFCSSIADLSNGKLLVTISEKGLLVFETREGRYTTLYSTHASNPNSLTNNQAREVIVDASGVVWICSENQGVDFFHPSKQKFQVIEPGQHASGNKVSFEVKTMTEDIEGNVWCGIVANGIAIFKEKTGKFEWIQTSDGPDGKKPFKNVAKLFTDRYNRVWVLSWEGVFLWLPDKKQLRALSGFENIFLDGFQLRNGKIILAAYEGGVFEVQEPSRNQFTLKAIPQASDAEPFISLWENSQGRLFGCKALKEIWVMDTEQNFRLIQKIPLEGESYSFCELERDSSVWVANSYGLIRLAWKEGKYERTIFTEKDGLTSSMVYSVMAMKDKKLWLGTGNGLSCADLRTRTFQNFGIADGISAIQFNGFAALKRKDGQFWFGSSKGITAFYPEKVELLTTQASPVITGILINDQEDRSLVCVETQATNVSEIKSLRLNYHQNTISFSFAALEMSDPSNTRFKYRLVGVDPDWVDAGKANFARYARIPPGQYTFNLLASNSDGIWSGSQSLKIYIEPPFTQTPLFYSMVGVVVLSLGWGVLQYRRNRRLRIRQMEEDKRHALESERQRIARDVHDDLGSGLSALSLLTEIARYKSSEHELRTELGKINAASRELSGKIREVIWTVNASNDTLANLLSYMNHYALELLDNAEIDYHVSLPNPIPEATIGGESRRTLFLAFKEALNNIIKHAGATKVNLDFIINPGELSISVMDNGKGFDPGLLVSSTGNGLLNMQARMRDIQGDCQFKTGSQGTQVVFSIKWTPKQV